MMKSMSENNNGNNSSSSNWLGFSLSPHLEMEAASSPPAAVQVEVSNSLFLSPLQHFNSSSAQCFSGNGHSSGFHQPPLLTAMPVKSDGSLCIMESHSEGLVATSSPKLENFLGAANHQYASHERETMALSLDSIYYHHQQQQQQHNAEQEEANRQHSLNMFQHHHSYYGVGDFFQAPMVETKGDMSDCNAQISEMANWVARSYSTQQGMELLVGGGGSDTTANIATTMVDNGGSGSIASMACGDIQSLTLSMSPGSQSSCVTPSAQISPSPADCLTMEIKKRGFGKVGQKQPVHRKSIDTFGQRTSQYRGVTKHRWTGRYEAHLWDNSCKKEGQTRKGRQVYLGGYDMEEKAARAYDLAALKYWGPSTHTNFPLENYKDELEEMKNMTRQEYVAHLRRKSSGFSRGASMYRGVTRHHQHGRWQARIGRVAGNKDLYLGTFSTQEEAAEAYDIAAIKFRGVSAVTNFDITRYDVEKIMSSNTLLAGEQAKKIKALEQNKNKNKTPIDESSSGWKMVNTSLDDLQKQQQSVGDESTKMASVQFSNGSSIVTSLNSSSREGSPDKSGSSLMIPKPPNIAWISPAQLRPATSAMPMAHLPFFAAWMNDA